MKNIRSANNSKPEIMRSIDAEGQEKVYIKGYAITFNSASRMIQDFWGDEFEEVILPTALTETDLSEVTATFNHEDEKHLASTWAGTLQLRLDSKGLYYELETPKTSYASDMIKLIEAGEVRGNSFEFTPKKVDWVFDTERNIYVRNVVKIQRLYAINPVFSPAYPSSLITSARGIQHETTPDFIEYAKALRSRFIK